MYSHYKKMIDRELLAGGEIGEQRDFDEFYPTEIVNEVLGLIGCDIDYVLDLLGDVEGIDEAKNNLQELSRKLV